ncbi:hypothetical protein [Sphingomonas sp. CV7422]|uniref:hypothetical protein n=1 Tax=Sphingomonas sp. CV7422 TaxID=3018036 RepID=UPI0022FE2A5A|nr:hypothetical protein [Sphingomonas sp. CV7422]
MTDKLDFQAVNDVTVAIECEMALAGRPHSNGDTLFMGGTLPTMADEDALGQFACSKNYKIVYPSFDATDGATLPTTFHVAVTDGLAQTIVLRGGRLWKRTDRSAAVLMFADTRLMVSLNAKGRLKVARMPGNVGERGYEAALTAVAARAAMKPGNVPIVAPVGGLITALDIKAWSGTFAKAA